MKKTVQLAALLAVMLLNLSPLFGMEQFIAEQKKKEIAEQKEKERVLSLFPNINFYEKLTKQQTLVDPSPQNQATAVAFSFDNKEIGIALNSGLVKLCNQANPAIVNNQVEFYEPIYSMSFAPWQNKTIVMGQISSSRATLKLWEVDISNKNVIDSLQSAKFPSTNLSAPIAHTSFAPNRLAFTATNRDKKSSIYYNNSTTHMWVNHTKDQPRQDLINEIILSPRENYRCAYNRDTSEISFAPLNQGTVAKHQIITIRTGQLIDHALFSLNGDIIAIITKPNPFIAHKNYWQVLNSENVPFHYYPAFNEQISLWDTSTGALIKKIDVPNGANLKTIALNANDDEIALLYNDGKLDLLTFTDPTKQEILRTLSEKPILQEIIYRGLMAKATGANTIHTMSDEQYKEWTKEPLTHREFLANHLNIREALKQRLKNWIGGHQGKLGIFFGIVAIWLWWSSSKK